MRAVIYARVSTKDREQDPEVQVAKLKQYCLSMEWPIVKTIVEKESGTKERKGIKEIMEMARTREIDVVIVWKFDRFTREGAYVAIDYIKRLDEYGVQFKSMTESFLDTTGTFGKQVLIPLFAWMAQQESIKISERVTAGIQYKKARGKFRGGIKSYNLKEEHFKFILNERAKNPKTTIRAIPGIFAENYGFEISKSLVHKICQNPENFIGTEAP